MLTVADAAYVITTSSPDAAYVITTSSPDAAYVVTASSDALTRPGVGNYYVSQERKFGTLSPFSRLGESGTYLLYDGL